MTNLGDLELSQWITLAQQVIEKYGEENLFTQLASWEKEHNPYPYSKSELLQKVLSLHIARIFDNPFWVDYVSFNEKNRPEVLDRSTLVRVQTDCCSTPCYTTKEIIGRQMDNRIPCPICGRWNSFSLLP